jgi:ElaB/YqjD/DUF883 family membrane-anchored ribosome-binding protein
VESPTVRERVVDATRRAAHVSHEARLLKSLAADALEDTAYTVGRAIRSARQDVQRSVDRLEDVRDDAARWIRHRPFKAFAIGLGAGAALGIVVAVASARRWRSLRTRD